MTGRDVLANVLRCTELNSSLSGASLTAAADAVFTVADANDACVIGVDDAGARIIGVSLTRHPSLRPADRSRPMVGGRVLLVGGFTAGPLQFAVRAQTLRATGAIAVYAAALSSTVRQVPGCDTLTILPTGALRALNAS